MVLRLKKYCEDDPIWKGLARNAVCGIVLYVIILTAVVMAAPRQVDDFILRFGNVQVIIIVAGSMAIVAAVYSLAADIIFRRMYQRKRSSLSRYRSDILRIDRLEQESK